jgi:hypothetical protein
MMVLKSCKKTDVDATAANNNTEDARAAAIKAIKAKYGNVSAGYIVNVNKTADEIFYKNAAGKMVSLYSNNYNPQTNSLCLYTCNNTNNPANLHIVYTLDYVQRFYLCESGSSPAKSTVSVKWTVSVPFAITDETPDGVLNTFGKVKFTPSSGPAVILTATANDAGFTYTSLGTDPNCGVNTLYAVTYYFNDVDNSNFASGTQLDALLSLANDCALIGYLSATGYVNAPSFNQSAYLPCNRIDKAYVVPNTGHNNCATVTGNYVICSYPGGSFSPIDYHQVEYRAVTHSTSRAWGDQNGTIRYGEPTGTTSQVATVDPYTGVSDLEEMLPSTGLWLVRYRNVNTTTCDVIAGPGGTWINTALWILELWDLT